MGSNLLIAKAELSRADLASNALSVINLQWNINDILFRYISYI